MKKIKFMFHNLGPYYGFSDGTSFMGINNVYVDNKTIQFIMKDYLSQVNSSLYSPIYLELSGLKPACDGLICLSAMNVQIIEGYFIYEYKDTRKVNLNNSKEILLDGHFFNIQTRKKSFLGKNIDKQREYGFDIQFHGKFETLDDAHSYLNNIQVSERTSSWPGHVDEDVSRGDIVVRRYKKSEYRIGDLGKSVTDIPDDVLDMSAEEVCLWATSILERAKKIQPEVYWFDNQMPLEIRIHKLKNQKSKILAK